MIKAENHKILVIHGPNMNLLGFKNRNTKERITLDKLNRHLRKIAREKELSLTIIQTNEEGRAVKRLQNNRKKIQGILLFPGPWQESGHVIKDTIKILSIPYIAILNVKTTSILKGIKGAEGEGLYQSSEKALTELVNQIQ